jgi:hypothetical protein
LGNNSFATELPLSETLLTFQAGKKRTKQLCAQD